MNSSNYGNALLTVGGFDASAAAAQNANNPGLEVIVDDGLMAQNMSSIKLIECATAGCLLDLGGLDFAGIYFYDNAHELEFFQDSVLIVENDAIWAKLALMREIAPIVARTGAPRGGNDMQMALAIDDLIRNRLISRNWGNDVSTKYSGVMRDLFRQGDVFYNMMIGGNENALSVMIADNPDRARNFVRGFGLDGAGGAARTLSYSSRLFRRAVSDQLTDDFSWQRYHDKKAAWGDVSYNTLGGDGRIISLTGGADWQVARRWTAGGNLGYNFIGGGAVSGGSFNLGAYGTYRAADWAKIYGSANLTLHSARLETFNSYAGDLLAKFSSTDAMLQLGLLHRIFDSYITGRAYADLGYLGGFNLNHAAPDGRNFIKMKSDGAFALTPGYEITLGKDIWFSYWSFMRPKLRFGIEYDLAGRSNEYDFQFAGAGDIWRNWECGETSRLWLKYGGGIDFSFFGPGTNIGFSYEVAKNGDFKSEQFKLDGSLRF
jgi:hypothetical protein